MCVGSYLPTYKVAKRKDTWNNKVGAAESDRLFRKNILFAPK
jgi:hypothetical protein